MDLHRWTRPILDTFGDDLVTTAPRPWRQHTLDIYGVEVFAVSTRNGWRELRKTLPFISKKPESLGLTEWSVLRPKKAPPCGHLVLWVDAKHHQSDISLVDTCAHEAHHGAARVLGWVGVDDGEASAYLAGWLTGWLYESITERGAE